MKLLKNASLKQKNNILTIITALFLFFALGTFQALAHPGHTDSSGGHYDNSTGEYHYHHGYPAHQHINGECPYDFDSHAGLSPEKADVQPEGVYDEYEDFDDIYSELDEYDDNQENKDIETALTNFLSLLVIIEIIVHLTVIKIRNVIKAKLPKQTIKDYPQPYFTMEEPPKIRLKFFSKSRSFVNDSDYYTHLLNTEYLIQILYTDTILSSIDPKIKKSHQDKNAEQQGDELYTTNECSSIFEKLNLHLNPRFFKERISKYNGKFRDSWATVWGKKIEQKFSYPNAFLFCSTFVFLIIFLFNYNALDYFLYCTPAFCGLGLIYKYTELPLTHVLKFVLAIVSKFYLSFVHPFFRGLTIAILSVIVSIVLKNPWFSLALVFIYGLIMVISLLIDICISAGYLEHEDLYGDGKDFIAFQSWVMLFENYTTTQALIDEYISYRFTPYERDDSDDLDNY